MSTNQPHPRSLPSQPAVEIDAHASPSQQADELFAHGLLQYLHTDSAADQQRRVNGVITALRAEPVPGGVPVESPVRHSAGRRWRLPVPTLRRWTAIAAAMGLITAVTILAIPRPTSAAGTLRESIAALRGPGDRRYEVRITTWDDADGDSGDEPHAIVDTRPPALMLIRARRPSRFDGDEGIVIVGRDARSRWAIRRDGSVERDRPELAWPRFAALENQSLFAESIDQMLEQMARVYDFSKGKDEQSTAGVMLRRVEGVRKQHIGPGPSEITVWIDDASKLVERIELRWSERDRRRFENAPPPPPGVDMRLGPDDFRPRRGPGMRRPGGPDGPPPEFRERDGPPRPPMRGDRPPRERPRPAQPDSGPDHDDPPPSDDAGPDVPPIPDGPPEGGPHVDRAQGLRPPMRDRARGDGPGDGPRRPPHRPLGERGMDGPGGPRGGGPGGLFRPPPPRKIVIERVDAPELADDWFTPERHASPASERDSWPSR